MPRRAIFLSVLACLCLAPDAALAVPLSTPRDAAPGNGSQVDPTIAISPVSGRRLVAATDVIPGTDTVHVWNRATGVDVPANTLVTGGRALQPSIAWDGNDAHMAQLATASTTGCTAQSGIDVRTYDPLSRILGAPTSLQAPTSGAGAQT